MRVGLKGWRSAKVAWMVAGIVAAAGHVQATPTFFVDSTPPSSLTNDLAWQAAVGTFSEIDFSSLTDGQVVPSFTAGSVTVTPTLPNLGNASPVVFAGDYAAGGGQFGSVFDNALITCQQIPCFVSGNHDSAMTFTFSVPVFGFGVWIFDDLNFQADSFAMTANGMTSPVLDANPGLTPWIVEGFLGVVDPEGISSLTIFNTGPDNLNFRLFELDHIQVSTNFPVPTPGTAWLLAFGVYALVARRSKRHS